MINGIYINGEPINGIGGSSPLFIQQAIALDGLHLRITFSEAVVQSEALNLANYVIIGSPAGLTILGIEHETDQVYILTTTDQVVGQEYFVTASNIHDLNGNRI